MSSPFDRKPTRRRRRQAFVEFLEPRNLLTTVIGVSTASDLGSGSLREAIEAADLVPGTDPVDIVFNLSKSDPGFNSTSGVWTVAVSSILPAITRPDITIDGTTQTGPKNSLSLGTGGTVGVDDLPLSTIMGPSVQIVSALPYGGVPIGLEIESANTTIRGLAISGFGSVPDSGGSANLLVNNAGSGTLIDGDIIGETATGQAPSGSALGSGDNIAIVLSGPGIIQNSLIADSQAKGISFVQYSNNWTIQGNEIRGNGINSWNLDGIDLEGGSFGETIQGNLIAANWANGIDSYQTSGGNRIVDNTIEGNGVGTYSYEEDAGVRLFGVSNLVQSNVIDGNYGAGVLIASGSLGDTITENSLAGNGTITNLVGAGPTGEIGVDLLGSSDNLSQGTAPFVTLNTPDSSRDGINGPANFPVFTSTQIQDGQLTISGYARPGSVIELYQAVPSANGFGQAQTYVGTFVTGSSADHGVGVGSYGPLVNGVSVGTDTTNLFQFTIPTPAGLAPGSFVTASATENGSTSEFGPQSQVQAISGPLTYQPTDPGPDSITLRQNGSNLQILDNGTVVAQQPLTMTTSVSIQGSTAGNDLFTLDDQSGGLFTVPGGISFQEGGSSAGSFNVIGDGQTASSYNPNFATTGTGLIAIGSQAVSFGGMGALSVSSLPFLTILTPDPGNILTVDSPASGQNRISGSSQSVPITPVSFSSIPSVTINTSVNDSALSADSITIGTSGLVAVGLSSFSVVTGSANSTLTILAPSLSLPVQGGSFSDLGGSGSNTLIASADVNYLVGSNSVSVPGSGSIGLSNVQNLQLTGGPDTSQINVTNWAGNLTLNGGTGTSSLAVSDSGSYGGHLSLLNFASTSIQIQGNFLGGIVAPTASTISSIFIGGTDEPGSSIVAGAFGNPAIPIQPALVVEGDLGGLIQAVENLSVPGSGVLSWIEINGNLLSSGEISTGAIGTLNILDNLAGSVLAQGGATIGTITVGGNLSGSVGAPEDPNPGSGNIGSVSINGSLTGTISTGNISNLQVGKDLAGVVLAQGAGTIGTITVGGNLSGSVNAPEDPNPGSGNITSISITGSLTGTVSSGNISGLVVGQDLAGVVIAQGSGTIGTITVGGNLSGSVSAPEDPHPGSGNITSISITGSLTGTVSSGNISGLVVGQDLAGVVLAQGSGTIGTITVGGNLSGSVNAPEDPNPGSGNITSISITGSLTGTVSSGNISGLVVGQDLAGVVLAQGSGSIGNLMVGGNLSGSVDAVLDSNATSGSIGSLTVDGQVSGLIQSVRQLGSVLLNSVASTGVIEAGNVTSSLTVDLNSGSIWAGNVAKFYGVNLSGAVYLGSASAVEYRSLSSGAQLNASSISSLLIDQNVAGNINVTGDLHWLNIPAGSVLTGSVIQAGSLDSATIGQNMAGEIIVSGTLGSLAVGGSTSGSVIAGHVGTISAAAGIGPVVLQIEENGVPRRLEVATPANPFPQPSQVASGSMAEVTFRYFYESGSLANPQLTLQIANQTGNTAPDQFDLSLVTDSDTAKFNLARLDAIGVSGLRSVSVEGDILTSVSSQASTFFSGDSNPAGIILPLDKLASVGVRDFIPYGGFIKAASIEALSAGSIGRSNGQTVMGANASAQDAQNVLAAGTKIVEANDTFRVPFADQSNLQVGFFLDDTPWGGFDWSNISFTVQSLVTADPTGKFNIVTKSNANRGADVALISVAIPSNSAYSQIQGINIQGDGASISTFQWIDGPITSTGSLGDLTLLNWQPVGNISASSIFGTITAYAPFNGTIQTTGLHTDPTTGLVSATNGDFGRVYVTASGQLASTQFVSYSGAFTSQLIVRGNLLSTVTLDGGLSGMIAAQGNLGAVYGTTRLGGVTVNGKDTGTILTLKEFLGDVTLNGNLGKDGALVSEGGMLGNVTVNGLVASTAKIVSDGDIGSTIYGTRLTVNGNINGLIAASGNLILTAYPPNPSHTFANTAGTSNQTALDDIFLDSDDGSGLIQNFDSIPGQLDLEELDDMLNSIANLHIDKNGKLSDDPTS